MTETTPNYRVTLDDMYHRPIENFDDQHWVNDILDAFWEADHEVHLNNYDLCVRRLKESLMSWVKAGAWAFQMKVKRVWGNKYRGWQEFCEKELGKSHWYVNHLIDAVRVVKELAEQGYKILPKNESQARPLAKLKGPDLIEAWDKVLKENLPHHITGKSIEATIKGEPLKAKKRLEIPLDNWEQFAQKAKDAGLDPQKVLNDFMGKWEGDDYDETEELLTDDDVLEVEEEKLNIWLKDLNDLVEEKEKSDNWHAKLTVTNVIPKILNQIFELFYPPDDWLISY